MYNDIMSEDGNEITRLYYRDEDIRDLIQIIVEDNQVKWEWDKYSQQNKVISLGGLKVVNFPLDHVDEGTEGIRIAHYRRTK
jgi:hypothetical protein